MGACLRQFVGAGLSASTVQPTRRHVGNRAAGAQMAQALSGAHAVS